MSKQNNDVSDWGDRLTHTLDSQRIKAATVAEALSVSRTTVGKWKKGGNIEYDNLRELAKYLKVNWIWLRYGDEAVSDMPILGKSPLAPVSERAHLKALNEDSKLLEALLSVGGWGRYRINLLDDSASNDRIAAMLTGFKPGEVKHTDQLHERTHPDDRAFAWEELSRVIREGQDVFHLHHRILVEGKPKQVENLAYIVRDNLGLATEVIGVIREATQGDAE